MPRRIREFRDSYLVPNNIGAMLDVPLQGNNHRLGVLCAEHVGGTRAWTVDEQNFAISVGNLIVIALGLGYTAANSRRDRTDAVNQRQEDELDTERRG